MNYLAARKRALVARDLSWIKRLIWAYFLLLIFEGALRKWIVPSLANPLLLVRDPIVLGAYFLAWRSGLFPRNVFISVAALLALATVTIGFMLPGSSPFVTVYGFRCNFFQIPFIFVIARALTTRDVERIGFWTLVMALFMGPLMMLQFSSPANAWINSGSEGNFEQIVSAMGKIRPPGTFSFIAGPVSFFSLAVAFLLSNQFRARYPAWLMWGATAATLGAMAVSGSRSAVLSIALVFVVGLACCSILRPPLALKWVGSLIVLGALAVVMSNIGVLQSGLEVFTQRVNNASGTEGGAAGLAERAFGGYIDFFPALFEIPLLGYGLGMGTNVGAVLLSGKLQFLLAEDEWSRVVLELGPLLGLFFIFYRVALVIWLGRVAWETTARRDPLALLLFGSAFTAVLNGNLGQTTILGFMILGSGLCLAAARAPIRAKISESATDESAQNDELLAPTQGALAAPTG